MGLDRYPVHIAASLTPGLALPKPAIAAVSAMAGVSAANVSLFGCALLGAALAILLWRQWRNQADLGLLRDKLAAEHRLRATAEQSLHDTHHRLRQLVAQQDSVKSDERWRIARDIHDDLGQNLLALKIDISALQASLAEVQPGLFQQLAIISCNVDLTVRSLRAIINDLRPIALDAGLRVALERQLHEFSRANGIACQLTIAPDSFESGLRNEIDIMVFRIVQESLANIARHAKAHNVAVALVLDADGLAITVRDNGIGMPPGPLRRGRGLLGIEDRLTAAGGKLQIHSEPGEGTQLSLSIPVGYPPAHARRETNGRLIGD